MIHSRILCAATLFAATLPAQKPAALDAKVKAALDRSRPVLLRKLGKAHGGELALLCLAAVHDAVPRRRQDPRQGDEEARSDEAQPDLRPRAPPDGRFRVSLVAESEGARPQGQTPAAQEHHERRRLRLRLEATAVGSQQLAVRRAGTPRRGCDGTQDPSEGLACAARSDHSRAGRQGWFRLHRAPEGLQRLDDRGRHRRAAALQRLPRRQDRATPRGREPARRGVGVPRRPQGFHRGSEDQELLLLPLRTRARLHSLRRHRHRRARTGTARVPRC